MNNSFIQNEHQRRRYLMKERQKRNRFMGWVLILIMLLFILPTFNLAQSYQQLLQRRQQLSDLQTQYQTLSDEKDKETAFATKLKDEDYAAKYTRAKYYYSKSREIVYTIPDLLQKVIKWKNLLDVIEKFLSLSDENWKSWLIKSIIAFTRRKGKEECVNS